MFLVDDFLYAMLSDQTINELRNCFKNCTESDIADYIFLVLNNAHERGEVTRKDSARLMFKALNTWQVQEPGEQSIIYKSRD